MDASPNPYTPPQETSNDTIPTLDREPVEKARQFANGWYHFPAHLGVSVGSFILLWYFLVVPKNFDRFDFLSLLPGPVVLGLIVWIVLSFCWGLIYLLLLLDAMDPYWGGLKLLAIVLLFVVFYPAGLLYSQMVVNSEPDL